MSHNSHAVSARLNPLFLLAGAFMVLAPLSVATGVSFEEPAKFLRLGTTALMVGIGAVGYECFRYRQTAAAWLVFVMFFVGAACWSDLPHWGLFHKGMFALTWLSGLGLAYSVRDTQELRRGLRWLGVIAACAGAATFGTYLSNPGAAVRLERLAVWGLNPNAIGMTAGPLFVLCAFLALYERVPRWRRLAYVACGLLALVILGTGSRGALLMAGSGGLVLALPLTKRPGLLFGVAVVVLGGVYMSIGLLDVGVDRLGQEMFKDTRGGIWAFTTKKIAQAPILGHGWLHNGTSSANVMNIYLQTVAETGIVGGFLLLVCLVVTLRRIAAMFRTVSRPVEVRQMAWLAAAFTTAVLVHGLAESGTFMGSTLNALLLGLGVGLIDRIPEFAAQESRGRRFYVVPTVEGLTLVPLGPRPSRRDNSVRSARAGTNTARFAL